jgi:hypothetical protein
MKQSGTAAETDNGTYSWANLLPQIKREIAALALAFPTTNVFCYTNWAQNEAMMQDLIAYILSLSHPGVGGPDIVPGAPTDGQQVWTGAVGGIDYRGLLPIGNSVQTPEMGGKEGSFTLAQFWAAIQAYGCTHVNWTKATQAGITPTWADAKAYIAAHSDVVVSAQPEVYL